MVLICMVANIIALIVAILICSFVVDDGPNDLGNG
jgi:hypothetical protein